MVQQMLREEAASFSRSDDDIGCIEGLQLNISLKDTTPVTRTYQSVPRPLYEEMKDYLHDLIAQGWVQKSNSPYSSPVVCVRKKDGSLRLCIDYRELNQKTNPDRQPIHAFKTSWTVLEETPGSRYSTKGKHITRVSWPKRVDP